MEMARKHLQLFVARASRCGRQRPERHARSRWPQKQACIVHIYLAIYVHTIPPGCLISRLWRLVENGLAARFRTVKFGGNDPVSAKRWYALSSRPHRHRWSSRNVVALAKPSATCAAHSAEVARPSPMRSFPPASKNLRGQSAAGPRNKLLRPHAVSRFFEKSKRFSFTGAATRLCKTCAIAAAPESPSSFPDRNNTSRGVLTTTCAKYVAAALVSPFSCNERARRERCGL